MVTSRHLMIEAARANQRNLQMVGTVNHLLRRDLDKMYDESVRSTWQLLDKVTVPPSLITRHLHSVGYAMTRSRVT
ncbi:hypothetical protein MLD38_038388 [Melastoma candidum]|uniref:Uncharacterized protein n=1 Tax=Melastoma candidum TaxID=119954 RepID=A0ACB9L119_9MYRT|nr:hypothetical protein MLD38_038388 [Melastoma candidum]